jgi:RNA polymerase sigma factor (sigma-70 family)
MPNKLFRWQDKYTERSDQELIGLYQQDSNKELVAALFGRYIEMLYGLCLKHLKDQDESSDAVYEIYEILLAKLSTHEVANFKSWLYRVASNYCVDKIRKNKMNVVELSSQMQLTDFSYELIDDMHEKELILQKITYCMSTLNPNQKTSIDLFFFQEKSYQEISQDLNITWEQTRSLIQNGKRNLKNCMEQR